jgi:hypothetical protein
MLKPLTVDMIRIYLILTMGVITKMRCTMRVEYTGKTFAQPDGWQKNDVVDPIGNIGEFEKTAQVEQSE